MTETVYEKLAQVLEDVNCVIFDLDNTLLDSHDAWRNVDYEFFKKRNITEPEGYGKSVAYMTFKEAAEYTIELLKLSESVEAITQEWFDCIQRQYSQELKVFDGVKELLEALKKKGKKIALATASDERLYTAALENNGVLQYFDAFASTEETERGKGFPDVYLLAAERAGAQPYECIVFEDIPTGIAAAKQGGMAAAAYFCGANADIREELSRLADFCFGDYAELTRRIDHNIKA